MYRLYQINSNYRRLLLISISLLILLGCASSPPEQSSELSYAEELRGAVFDPPRTLADFSLMATTGEMFTLSDYRGQIILLYFGYRTCPDFCPMTFTELRQIYRELGEPADQVKVVFVTVDPERDDLATLTTYTQGFHEHFIGLRGEGESLDHVIEQFGVVAERQQLGDSPLSYLIDHTASLFLIGPDGRLQVQYLYGTNFRDILHDVRLILQTL
jgi:protein SCO1